MNGRARWQKFTLGIAYLAVCGALSWKGLSAGADATSLGVLCGGLATGVAAIVWGNVEEHRVKTS